MKVKHILVAIADPSARSSAALAKAAMLARKSGAEVTIFHSLYSPYVAGEQFYSPDALEKDIEGAVNARKAQLARLLPQPAGGDGIDQRRDERPELETLLEQAAAVRPGREGHRPEPVRVPAHDVERAQADRAGRAQDGDALPHGRASIHASPRANTGMAAVRLSMRSSTPP